MAPAPMYFVSIFLKKCGQIVLVNVLVNDSSTTKTLLAAGGSGIRRTSMATQQGDIINLSSFDLMLM